jgi:hypothetical protein
MIYYIQLDDLRRESKAMDYRIEYNRNTDTFDAIFEDGAVWPARNKADADDTAQAYIASLECQPASLFDTPEFDDAVETAKAAVRDRADSNKWIGAIDRAVEMAHDPSYSITPFADGLEIVKADGTTYFANGICNCEAYQNGLGQCKHRTLAKLYKRMRESN